MKSAYLKTASKLTVSSHGLANLVATSVFGGQDARLLRQHKVNTASSDVFRLEYEIDGVSRALYVKLPRKSENRTATINRIQQLQREYHLAKNIKCAFESDFEMQTVIPACFITEINALVTWEVCGVSLQNKISSKHLFKRHFRHRHDTADPRRLSQLAGNWLRRFHSLELVVDKPNLRLNILNYCEERLENLCRNKNSGVSTGMVISLMKNISSWIDDALSLSHAEIILCHNDFSPHNILVTDKGICVLDFAFSSPGLPAFDLACFWHKLEDMKGSIVRGRRKLENLQNSFVHAYGFDFDTSRPDVKLGLVRLVLSKMVTIMNSIGFKTSNWMRNRHRYKSYLLALESDFEL